MDKFEKQDEQTARLFRELVAGSGCEERKMFGYAVGFIGGNMFAGVFADRLFFRVAAAEQVRMKAEIPGLRDFEPVKGRRMKDYLEIGGKVGDLEALRRLARTAEAATRALPVKKAKGG